MPPPRQPQGYRRARRVTLPFAKSLMASLSIDGTTIRVLGTRGQRVECWGGSPLDARFLRNGFVADPNGVGQALRQALHQVGLERQALRCALPGFQAISRVLSVVALPGMSRGRLDALINREVRRTLGPAYETSHVFWQQLPGPRGQRSFFVLAIPREPLQALLMALEIAGVRPRSLDLKPLAAARAVGQRQAIVAHVERTSADVVILDNGVPKLLRSVHFGDEPLADDYAILRAADELVRTISFYNDTNRANPLALQTPVYRTGELAEDPRLSESVATMTGRPTPSWQAPLRCPPGFPLTEYAVAVGLALKQT